MAITTAVCTHHDILDFKTVSQKQTCDEFFSESVAVPEPPAVSDAVSSFSTTTPPCTMHRTCETATTAVNSWEISRRVNRGS